MECGSPAAAFTAATPRTRTQREPSSRLPQPPKPHTTPLTPWHLHRIIVWNRKPIARKAHYSTAERARRPLPKPPRRAPRIILSPRHQSMFHGIRVHITQPRRDSLLVRQLRIPILKPHLPPRRAIQPIHKLSRNRMQILHQPPERSRLLRIADKVIMIGENSPSMQPPAIFLSQRGQRGSQIIQSLSAMKKRRLLIRSRRNHVCPALQKTMHRRVRPIAPQPARLFRPLPRIHGADYLPRNISIDKTYGVRQPSCRFYRAAHPWTTHAATRARFLCAPPRALCLCVIPMLFFCFSFSSQIRPALSPNHLCRIIPTCRSARFSAIGPQDPIQSCPRSPSSPAS